MNLLSVFKKPLITEKNYKLLNQQKYVFIVDAKARKLDIKLAFEKIFATKVKSINIIKTKSKPRRIGRFSGYTKAVKKALITLFPGNKLDLLSNTEQEDKTKKIKETDKSLFTRFKETFFDLQKPLDNKVDK